ncbi:MAG: MlaD family protein [Syntrophobacterales bacterium]|jgi:phospholipid/cholesterol/gamma-HCH transport system substrate-binding protein|nr:MlaD family protein [Syntrophobacterales bacterium]
MARKKFSSFLLGLFVTGGFIILAIVLIWVGASQYFERGRRYISYFNESVQGLQKDSEVKFRGVKVGRVEDIVIAPDNRQVGVVMLINLTFDPTREYVAQLELTGITGVMFVNLMPQNPEKPYVPPRLTFVAPYPVIPSQPSEIKRILTGIDEVIANLKELDTKGISDGAKLTFQEMQNFFGGEKTKRIIAELEAGSTNLKKISARINKDVAKGEVGKILLEAKGTFEGTRTLIANAKKDLEAMRLPETVGKSRLALGQINALVEKLGQTSETLDLLVERIYQRPPDLLFGKPPKKRWNE